MLCVVRVSVRLARFRTSGRELPAAGLGRFLVVAVLLEETWPGSPATQRAILMASGLPEVLVRKVLQTVLICTGVCTNTRPPSVTSPEPAHVNGDSERGVFHVWF